MDRETLELVALVATIVSMLIAAGSFVWSTRQAARVRDVNFITTYMSQLGERWRAFLNAETPDEWEFALVELLNLYDSICLVLNRGLIGPLARQHFERRIIEVLARLAKKEDVREHIAKARNHEDDFYDLLLFCEKRRIKACQLGHNLQPLARLRQSPLRST